MFFIIIIIFIALNIINILTKFYFFKFVRNFLKAIPLFIKDLIRLERKIFRGYGFWMYCGLGGSGKTISMVEYLTRMKKKYPKVKILTNFDFKFSDGKIENWEDLIKTENIETVELSEEEYNKHLKLNRKGLFIQKNSEGNIKYYRKINHGVIFGFDEIHLTFESTKWANAPDNLLDYISQQRKLHKQIVGSSQVFTRINKKLREQTNFVIECKSIFFGRLVMQKFFNTAEYICNDEKMDSGNKRRKPIKRHCFVATDYIRELYNTEQIMKELSVGKSEDKVFLDKISKYMKGD